MYPWENSARRSGAGQFWSSLKSRPVLFYLLLVNIAVFLLVQIINLFLYLSNLSPFAEGNSIPVASWWLGMHASISGFVQKPWGIISYAFVHEDILHILFNLLLLYFGAQLFLTIYSAKRLLYTYVLGGIAGALMFMLAINSFPRFNPIIDYAVLIGASASALAIFFAVASKAPNMQIQLFLFGRVKLIYIALAFIAIDMISIDNGNPGGHLAHLGGALWGFISVKISDIQILSWSGLKHTFKRRKRPGPRLYDPVKDRPLTDDEFNQRKREREKKIDAILDKLKERGYEGLSKEEKDFLNSIR